MKTKFFIIFLLNLGIIQNGIAQNSFIEGCLGTWKGKMYIYNKGNLRDSVEVRLTVSKTNKPDEWSWKTEYLSAKMPMVKDYVLRLKDASKNAYVTDEGNGIELADYLFNNKLYCVFETHNIILTSTYELRENELIFEVTSGKKGDIGNQEVVNYPVENLQRVVFKK
ncbi:hypothetical protein GCM10011514_33900 [Emticicia aquatilis]|uniref:Uncharacterized protein n=1 Tax=Emticicia aquatilis TaxID=1537369 RepID=A0A916YYH1_9BACT|nr:hypothetical protein [Emticicia aquatilis]GGD67056.1 hypothetical protein GCM10011514_33900 [Emticicia aquatilis]